MDQLSELAVRRAAKLSVGTFAEGPVFRALRMIDLISGGLWLGSHLIRILPSDRICLEPAGLPIPSDRDLHGRGKARPGVDGWNSPSLPARDIRQEIHNWGISDGVLALILLLRSSLIQIGARFLDQFLSLRDGVGSHGLNFAFGHNPALNKPPNHRAQPACDSRSRCLPPRQLILLQLRDASVSPLKPFRFYPRRSRSAWASIAMSSNSSLTFEANFFA